MRLLLLALLLVPVASLAQSGESVLIEQAGVALAPSAVGLNAGASRAELLRSLVPEAADANTAVVDQDGVGNVLSLTQQGMGNQFFLSQVGGGLVASFAQTGTDNLLELSMEGTDNVVTGAQVGDRNSYTLSISGSGTEHEIFQFGNDLSALQVVGAGMLPVSIEQRGTATAVVVVRQ